MAGPTFEIKEVFSPWQKKNVRTIIVNAHSKNFEQRSIASAISKANPYDRIELVGGEYLEPLSISIPLEIVGSDGEEPHIVSRNRAVSVTANCRVYFANVAIFSKNKQRDCEAVGVFDGEVFFEKCKLSSIVVASRGHVNMNNCYIQKSPSGIGLAARDEGSGVLRDCTIHTHYVRCVEMNTTGTFLIENCSIYNKGKDGGDLFVATGSESSYPSKFPASGRVTLCQSRLYISVEGGNPEGGTGGKNGVAVAGDKQAGSSFSSFPTSSVEREKYSAGDPCCVVITNGAAPTIKQNIFLEGYIGILLHQAGHATLTKNTIQYQRRGGIVALLPKLSPPRSTSDAQNNNTSSDEENELSGLKIMGDNLIDHCFIGIDIHTKAIPKLPSDTDAAILESCTFSPCAGGGEAFSWLKLPDVASAKVPSSSSSSSVAKMIKENSAIVVPVHGSKANIHDLQYQLRALAVMVLQIFRWCLNPDFGKRTGAPSTRVSAQTNGNYFSNQLLHSFGLNIHDALIDNTPSSISTMVEKISISSTIFNRCGLCAIRFGSRSYGSVEQCKFDENFRHAIIVGSGACPIITGCVFTKCMDSAILVGGYANPLVIGNHMVDGDKNAIEVTTLGRGIYMANYISTFMGVGIEVNNESDPLICGNMIKRNASGGIKVNTYSSPLISLNVLSVNSVSQIQVSSGSSPFIVRNSIQSGLGVGIQFTSSSKGVVRKNHLISNKLGVLVEKHADPEILNNIIEKNSIVGITVHQRGLGTICLNDILSNGTNVMIMEGGDCVLRGNTISKGIQGGVVVRKKGNGTIEKNHLKENGVANLLLTDAESHALCVRNTICGSSGCGVIVANKGNGYFARNQIYENALCGVYVVTEANPEFVDNHISREVVGILVSEGGRGEFKKNVVDHIYGIGFMVQRRGAPMAKENRFTTCEFCALQIGNDSSGLLEQNVVTNSFFGVQIGSSLWPEKLDVSSVYFSSKMDSNSSSSGHGGSARHEEVRQRRSSVLTKLSPIVIRQNDVTENYVAGILVQSAVNCQLEENKVFRNGVFGVLGDSSYWERQDENNPREKDREFSGGENPSPVTPFFKVNKKIVPSSYLASVRFVKNHIFQHAFANIYFSQFEEKGVKLIENTIFDSPVGMAVLRYALVEETIGNHIHHCVDGIQVVKGGTGSFCGNRIEHCSHVGIYISENGAPDLKSGNQIEYCRLCGVLCDVGASGKIRQSTIRQCGIGVWVMCAMDSPFQPPTSSDAFNAPYSHANDTSLSHLMTTSVLEENLITENMLHGVALLSTCRQETIRPVPECAIPSCVAWKDGKREGRTSSCFSATKLSSSSLSLAEYKPFIPHSTSNSVATGNLRFSKNVIKNNRVCGFYMDRVDAVEMNPPSRFHSSIKEKSVKATSDAILGSSLLGTSREHLDERAKQQPYLLENRVEGSCIGMSVGPFCHPLLEGNVLTHNLFFGLLLRPHSAVMAVGCEISDNGLAGVYACQHSKGTLCDSFIAHNGADCLQKCTETAGEESVESLVSTTALATVLVMCEDKLRRQTKALEPTRDNPKSALAVNKTEVEEFLFFPKESARKTSEPNEFQSLCYQWLTEVEGSSGTDDEGTPSATAIHTALASDSSSTPSDSTSRSTVLFKWMKAQYGTMASLTSAVCTMITSVGFIDHDILTVSAVLPPRPSILEKTYVGDDGVRDKYGFVPSNRPSPRQVHLLQGGIGIWVEQSSRTTVRHNTICDHHQVGVFIGTGIYSVFTQLQIALKNTPYGTSIRETNDGNNKAEENPSKMRKGRKTEDSPSVVAKKTLSAWDNAATANVGMKSGDKSWALLLFFTTESSSFVTAEQQQLWNDSVESLRSTSTSPSPPLNDNLSFQMIPRLKTPQGGVNRFSSSDSLKKSPTLRKEGVKGHPQHEGSEHHPSMLVENNCVTGNAEGIHVQLLHTVRAVVNKSVVTQSPNFDPVSSPKAEESDKRSSGVLARRFFPRYASPEGKQGMVGNDDASAETPAEMNRKQAVEESVVVIRENRIFDNTKVGVYAEHFMEVQCHDVFESATSLWSTVVSTAASPTTLKSSQSSAAFVFPSESSPLVETKDFPFLLPAATHSSHRCAIICENDIYANNVAQAEVTSQYAVVSKDQAKSLVEMSTFLDPSNVKNKFSSSQFLCRVPAIAALFQRMIPGTIHLHNNHFHDSDCGLRCFGVLCADNIRVYRNEFFRFEREAMAVLGHLSALTAGPGNVFHDNQIAVHIHVHVPRREVSLASHLDYETKVFKCVFSAQRQQSVRILGVGGTPARVDDNTFTGHGNGAVAMLLLSPSMASLSSSEGNMEGMNGGGTPFNSVTVCNNTFAYNYLPLVVMGEEGTKHSGTNSLESTMTLPFAALKDEQEGEESSTVTKKVSSPFRRSTAGFAPFQEKPKPILELLIIARNDFSFNVIGALICNGASLRLVRNLFFRNTRAGLEVSGVFTCPVIEECVFLQNSSLHVSSSEKNDAKKEQKSNHRFHPVRKSGSLEDPDQGKKTYSIPCTKSFLSVQHVSPSRFEWGVVQKEISIRGVPLPISVSPIHQYDMGDHHAKHSLSCGMLLNPGSQCTVTRCQFDQNDVGVDAVRCIVGSKDEKLALFTKNVFQHHFVAGVMVRFCETASIRESAALLTRGSFPKETTRFESNFFLDNAADTEKGFGDVVGREFGTAVFRGNLFYGMVHGLENGYVWLDSNHFLPESSTSQSADAAIVLHHATKLMGTKNIIGKRKIGIESQEDSAGFMAENIIMECSTGIRSLYLSKTRFSKNRILGSTAAAMVVYSGELDENEIVFSKDGIVVRDVTSTKVTHVIAVNRRHEGKAKIHRNRLYSCEKEGILVGTPAEIIGNTVQDSNVGIHLIPFHVKIDKDNEDEWNLVRSNFLLMNFIGLLVEEKAMSLIKDNDVFDNASVGVSVEANASGALHGNRISTNKEDDAMVIATASKLRVSNNTIRHRFSPVFNRVPHNCRFKEMSAFLQGVVEEMEGYNKGWGDMVGQERLLEQSFSRLDIGSCADTSFSTFVIDSSTAPTPSHSLDHPERGLRSLSFLAGSPTLDLRHKTLDTTFGMHGSLKNSAASSMPAYHYRTSTSGVIASNFRSLSLNDGNKSIEDARLEPPTLSIDKILSAGNSPVDSKPQGTDLSSPFMPTANDDNSRKGNPVIPSPRANVSEDVPPQSFSPVVPRKRLGTIRTSFSSPLLSETLSAPHRSSSGQLLPVKEGEWKPPNRFARPSTLSAIDNGCHSPNFGASGKSTLIARACESAILSAQAARAKEAERMRNETTPLLLHILARPSGQKEADQWGKALSSLLTKPPLDKIHFRVFVSSSKEALSHTMEENPPEVLLLLAHPSCSGPSSSLEREVLSFVHHAAAHGPKNAVHSMGRAGSMQAMPPSPSALGMKRNSMQLPISPRPHRLSSGVSGIKFTLGLFSEKQIEEDSEFSKIGINASIASLFDEGNNGVGPNSTMSLSAFSAAHRTLMYSNSVDELHNDVVYILQNEFKPEVKPSPRVPSLLLSTPGFSFGTNSFSPNFSSALDDSSGSLTPTASTPSMSASGNVGGGVRRKVGGDHRPSTGGERRFTLEDVAQLMSLIDPKSTIDPKEERRKKKKKKKEDEKQLLLAKAKDGEEEGREEERMEKDRAAPAPPLSLSSALLPTSDDFDSPIEKKKKFKKMKSKASSLASPGKMKSVVSNAQKRMSNAVVDGRNKSLTSSSSLVSAEISSTLSGSVVEKKELSIVLPSDQ